MLKRWLGSITAGAVLLFVTVLPAAGEVAVPPLKARVTDLTGTLSAPQVQSLESRLRDFERAKGSQIAVLLLPTTQPETVAQYSVRVYDAWKLGREGIDDGVLLVVAKDDRRVWITTGRGAEGPLPDVAAKRITEELIVPRFKQGDFYGGISAGVDRIVKALEGEGFPVPRSGVTINGTHHAIDIQTIFWLFAALIFTDALFRRLFGRVVGAGISGAIIGAIVWVAAGVLVFAVLGGLVGFVIALLNGMGGPRGGWPTSGGWSRGGWSGGGFGGGGFGGGGGFSGGGGSTGGGGAGGSW